MGPRESVSGVQTARTQGRGHSPGGVRSDPAAARLHLQGHTHEGVVSADSELSSNHSRYVHPSRVRSCAFSV
jgi:hypothetical protein